MAKKPQPTVRKRRRNSRKQIDVAALLNKKVTVGKDGRKQSMSPFEVSLRAQVKNALKEHNQSAINSLLAVAKKYQLVAPPPETPEQSGVLIWPRLLTAKSGDDLFGEAGKAKTDSKRNDDSDT